MQATTVLVVDDDPAIRTIVSLALEDEGYRVLSAVDGEAVEVARQRRPAVVLLDLSMPGMDGAAVSRQLRADPATAGIPIILMSGHADLRWTTAGLPVNERLAKPFDLDRLSTLIARWKTVSAGERHVWRVGEEQSFAFDRATRRVVAICFKDLREGWWVLIRQPPARYGPFETPLQARQDAARLLQEEAHA